MIVVAIIAILATVALPKFGQLIRKSNETSTRSKMKTLRSALNLYYAQNDGYYPSDLTPFQQSGNKYLKAFPQVNTSAHGNRTTVDYPSSYDDTIDGGTWGYVGTGADAGKVWVECTHTDLAGAQWSKY